MPPKMVFDATPTISCASLPPASAAGGKKCWSGGGLFPGNKRGRHVLQRRQRWQQLARCSTLAVFSPTFWGPGMNTLPNRKRPERRKGLKLPMSVCYNNHTGQRDRYGASPQRGRRVSIKGRKRERRSEQDTTIEEFPQLEPMNPSVGC